MDLYLQVIEPEKKSKKSKKEMIPIKPTKQLLIVESDEDED